MLKILNKNQESAFVERPCYVIDGAAARYHILIGKQSNTRYQLYFALMVPN